MGFFSWLKKTFGHFNAQHAAAALAVGQRGVDQIGAIENWPWLPDFDKTITPVIQDLNKWQKGQPTQQIVEGLNAAIDILNAAPGLSAKDKAIVDICIDSGEAALAGLA